MNKKKDPLKGLKISYVEGGPLPDGHIAYRKRQYEQIKNNKNIIRHVMPRNISDKEEDAAHKWWTGHLCFRSKEFWDHTTEDFSPYPNIKFIESSMGVSIYIICPKCKEEENVTDYDLW